MQPIFDRKWRDRALKGDPDAVRVLADETLTPLYRFCFHRVGGDRDLCEEIVQETLIRALRDLSRYEPSRAENNIFPWLAGLARNEIRRVLNRRKTAPSLEALWEKMDRELLAVFSRLESEPLPEQILQREETREMVNAAMSQLPAHYREALEAKYFSGLGVREVAKMLHLTVKA
ncbi:MAG: sigma-70 family RNA polymerase sigma factor, partial [Planctomycetales bacterium]